MGKKRSVLISVLGIVLVVVIVFISVRFFRGNKNTNVKTEDQQERLEESQFENNTNLVQQVREPDSISKKLAEEIHVDAKQVVSIGHPAIGAKYSYTVTSWNVSKDFPGFKVPNGVDLESYPGAELDEAGNIINEYSYVVVNICVENISNQEIERDPIWGTFRLKFVMPPSQYSEYIGIVDYLGEEVPREDGIDYYAEKFELGEKKEMAMIFVVNDGLLESKGAYLEINPTGAVIDNPKYDIRQYIALK